jgi:nitrate/nitrite transporter NarK
MSNGATYGIVPFVNEKNVGLVSGIVGAGGNLGRHDVWLPCSNQIQLLMYRHLLI